VKIYTGNAYSPSDLEQLKGLDLGIMLASSASKDNQPQKRHKPFSCALDNGAFQCWQRGFPFMPDVFRSALANAYRAGLSLDFIVAPDIVTGGKKSLDFSLRWAYGELETAQRLALAVQDGMTPKDVRHTRAPHRFSHIFVGGSNEWKWSTAEEWIGFAHELGMKCHIGRCGTLERLQLAAGWGADSVDSTNFVRNKSWHVVEKFIRSRTTPLFEESK
jgi:hypothetical protein